MRQIFRISNVRVELTAPDLDGDGITGGVERLEIGGVSEVIPVQQKSETAEAVENLNKDQEDSSRLSTMDFLSRINPNEYEAMTKIDILIALRFLPKSVTWINRSKMRKSVSLKGEGRKEFINLATGNQQVQNDRSGLAKLFGRKKEE